MYEVRCDPNPRIPAGKYLASFAIKEMAEVYARGTRDRYPGWHVWITHYRSM